MRFKTNKSGKLVISLFIFIFLTSFIITFYLNDDKNLTGNTQQPIAIQVNTGYNDKIDGSVSSSTSSSEYTVKPESAENTQTQESTADNQDKPQKPMEINGLVELLKIDESFVLDLKYATDDNFTSKIIYSQAKCLINKNTAQKLIAANNEFKGLGLRIKIYDAYRPSSAQVLLWNAAKDKSFVASPKKGSIHNKGAAVDLTLVDGNVKELEMPSLFDELSERSHLDYSDCAESKIKNRELLGKIMVKNGFRRISNEWWHFEDTDSAKYPFLDIQFEEFK